MCVRENKCDRQRDSDQHCVSERERTGARGESSGGGGESESQRDRRVSEKDKA